MAELTMKEKIALMNSKMPVLSPTAATKNNNNMNGVNKPPPKPKPKPPIASKNKPSVAGKPNVVVAPKSDITKARATLRRTPERQSSDGKENQQSGSGSNCSSPSHSGDGVVKSQPGADLPESREYNGKKYKKKKLLRHFGAPPVKPKMPDHVDLTSFFGATEEIYDENCLEKDKQRVSIISEMGEDEEEDYDDIAPMHQEETYDDTAFVEGEDIYEAYDDVEGPGGGEIIQEDVYEEF